jgi:hypothetical protein
VSLCEKVVFAVTGILFVSLFVAMALLFNQQGATRVLGPRLYDKLMGTALLRGMKAEMQRNAAAARLARGLPEDL